MTSMIRRSLLTRRPVIATDAAPIALLKTEDTGKIFEMAICLAYNIDYDGKYKYDMDAPRTLQSRLTKLTELFPTPKHTAKRGARYDFTCPTDEAKHLSAKTTKKGMGKVAPQVIGQSQPKKFCEVLGIDYTDIPHLKEFIQTNPIRILPALVDYTFDCPNVYYNEELNTIRYITLDSPVSWADYEYTWTCSWDKWNNSSTLKILHDDKEIPLVEFQFHTKSRTNMAIRWCYENFLTVFRPHLTIIDI